MPYPRLLGHIATYNNFSYCLALKKLSIAQAKFKVIWSAISLIQMLCMTNTNERFFWVFIVRILSLELDN